MISSHSCSEPLERRRLLSENDPDPSFGIAGIVSTTLLGHRESANGLVVQGDGKIIAAGSAETDTSGEVAAVARFNADGTLDASFSDDGKAVFGTTRAKSARHHSLQRRGKSGARRCL